MKVCSLDLGNNGATANSTSNVDIKLARLHAILRELDSVLVAHSGGLDSTLLLKVAHDVLGARVLAATATSEIYPQRETNAAAAVAAHIGVRHVLVPTQEIANERFAANTPLRCYECKQQLYGRLVALAQAHGLAHVVDGFNVDDGDDFRPGTRAARELGIRSPLFDAGFVKQEIRELSRRLELPTWDKPSQPCLSTRFPYGEKITASGLARIEFAEELLARMGLKQFRLRDHGDTARLEVEPHDFALCISADLRRQLVHELKALGFTYVTLDLEGYRTGSMNAALRSSRPAVGS
ncbi:MAG: ATP-dependent sacrificial sulfur transferase LarE [Planctomycetota bacterium]